MNNTTSKKRKILFVITKSNWGGAQRYVFDLSANLPKDQFEAVVACGGSGPLIEKLEKSGIRVIKIPHLERGINIMKEVLSLFSLWQIFEKEKPDIIHLNSSKVGGLGALASRLYSLSPKWASPRWVGTSGPIQSGFSPKTYNLKPKIVFTAHGWPFNEDRFFLSRFIIWVLSWLTAFFSHKVIVLTKKDLDSTMNFILTALDKFHLIPNGINEGASSYLERETAQKELGLNLEPSITLLGCITEFIKNKGIRYLIESVKELPDTAHLTLIGNGAEKNEMEKLADDLGVANRIHFLGFRQDGAKFLKALDIFVFPSIKEGLPYALLEAGLAGLPTVASNVGGIPDIITDQENGLLVEPKNPHALAEAIKKLLENKETSERLGKKISEKIKTEFSFEKMLEKTLQIYN